MWLQFIISSTYCQARTCAFLSIPCKVWEKERFIFFFCL